LDWADGARLPYTNPDDRFPAMCSIHCAGTWYDISFPYFMAHSSRTFDLLEPSCADSLHASGVNWNDRQNRAVFRGGPTGKARSWLFQLSKDYPQLLDAVNTYDHWYERMELVDQQHRFNYVIYIEGSFNWADR
jgi:hypothetical protein